LKRFVRYILILLIITIVYALGGNTSESRTTTRNYNELIILPNKADEIAIDTTVVLPYEFEDEPAFAYPNKKDSSRL